MNQGSANVSVVSMANSSARALLAPAAKQAIEVARQVRSRHPFAMKGADDLVSETRRAGAVAFITSLTAALLIAVSLGVVPASLLSLLAGTLSGYVIAA